MPAESRYSIEDQFRARDAALQARPVTAPDRAAAVNIAAGELAPYGLRAKVTAADAVVAALTAAKLLRRPDEAAYVAALEAVAAAARRGIEGPPGTDWWYRTRDALAALDAVPAAGTGSREK